MTDQSHIMIVDGDHSARETLAGALADCGFGVSQAASAAEATAQMLLRGLRADMVLIETALPDGDGRELVSRLRRRGVVAPLILLSAQAGEDDVVHGLEAGADDYVVRPVRLRELLSRIRARLRTVNAREDADIRIGPALFRPALRTLVHPHLPCAVRLTEKETALLLRLCRAEGRSVSRQSLLREVWGYHAAAASHTVETHIYRLRRKIEAHPDSPSLLLNEAGGYRLCVQTIPVTPHREAHPGMGWPAGILAAQARLARVQPAA